MLRGKLEFASGEEGREAETLTHLLRRATADTARARLRGLDLIPLAEAVSRSPVRTGERVPPASRRRAMSVSTATRGRADTTTAAELALEYLVLTRTLAKDESDDETVTYG